MEIPSNLRWTNKLESQTSNVKIGIFENRDNKDIVIISSNNKKFARLDIPFEYLPYLATIFTGKLAELQLKN